MIRELKETRVSEYASKPVLKASLGQSLLGVVRLMAEKKIRRIPVVDENDVVAGVLTSTKASALILRVLERELAGGKITLSQVLEKPVEAFLSYDYSKLGEGESLLTAVWVMFRKASGYVLVFNERDELTGILTERDVVRRISSLMTKEKVYFHMSRDPVGLQVGSRVIDAHKRMVDRGVRRITVLDGEKPVGIASETSLIKYYSSDQVVSRLRGEGVEPVINEDVRRVMHPRVISIFPEATLEYAADLMEKTKAGAVVVEDKGRVVGVLTERDLLRAAIGLYYKA